MTGKKQMIRRDDKNFRRDVIRAKIEYRKKRMYIILSVCIVLLTLILVRNFFYLKEKAELEKSLAEQDKKIEQLHREKEINEIIIKKLRDPYFITDFVRQNYSLSYSEEVIFNLPLQDNYIGNVSKSIMDNPKLYEDNLDESKLIKDEKIAELLKNKQKEEEKKKKEEDKNKKNSGNEEKSEEDPEEDENSKDKKDN